MPQRKKKLRKLPYTIYVYRDITVDETDQWLTVHEDIKDCAEMGETRLVGIYVLQNTAQVSTEITVDPKE